MGNVIESDLYRRKGKAISNFKQTLPLPQSDIAQQVLKDPYNFGFLSLDKEYREKELEQGLMDHLQTFLRPISLTFLPSKGTTQIENFNHEWRSVDFPSFLEECYALQSNMKEACLFRGHRKSERLIDSTFARNLKKEQGVEVAQRYSDDLINDVNHQPYFSSI